MPTHGALVLVIDDEAQMRRFLRATLASHGYRVVEASTASEGATVARAQNPDLILLDLGLPDGDGLDLTKDCRRWTNAPILVISARGQECDKVAALDLGADDYVTKPFGTDELLARIRAALRHRRLPGEDGTRQAIVVFGAVRIDPSLRKVEKDGAIVHLTPLEYKLVLTLVENEGRVMTHRQLLQAVWGPNCADKTHYLRVYMAQVRNKLEDEPARPVHFLTEAGVGYRFEFNGIPPVANDRSADATK